MTAPAAKRVAVLGFHLESNAFAAVSGERDGDLVIEIPKYTINYEREGGGKK